MGAYNVKPSANTTSQENTTTEQPRDDKDTEKEKKRHDDDDDDDGNVERKRIDMKRPRDEEHGEERTDIMTEERSEEVQKFQPTIQDNHHEEEEESKQESTKKKHAEKRNTDEAVMAARERYLARKRMRQETQQ